MTNAKDQDAKPPESAQDAPPCPAESPKAQAYCAAMDLIAEGTRKLSESGMNGTEAGKIAADIFCKCCD